MNSWYPGVPTFAPKRSRRVGDVARELQVTVRTVHYWLEKFPFPVSRTNGQRYFTPEALNRLRLVKFLLRHDGYTIEGARKHLDRLISCNW